MTQRNQTIYKLIRYNDTYYRLECIKSCPEERSPLKFGLSSNTASETSSLSRTKRNIKSIALANNFEYFSTLTVNSQLCDRFSLEACQNKLKKINKEIKRKYKDFRYIFITEEHKKGGFHFHGLIGGIPVGCFFTNVNGYLSLPYYSQLGFNSFSLIVNYNKCCNYITKYITKHCLRNEHNQIYISSRGLKKADEYEILPIAFPHTFENDFVQILDIDLSKPLTEEYYHILSKVTEMRKFLKTDEKLLDKGII